MVRTQIQLTEEQAERLKEAASRRGVSVAELVRQGVEILLAQSAGKSPSDLRQRAKLAAGRHQSGLRDVATGHDRYLGRDFAE